MTGCPDQREEKKHMMSFSMTIVVEDCEGYLKRTCQRDEQDCQSRKYPLVRGLPLVVGLTQSVYTTAVMVVVMHRYDSAEETDTGHGSPDYEQYLEMEGTNI